MKKQPKCLLIYSGGLDSTLAVKVLEEQGIDVIAINFVSYFFGSGTAEKTAKANNIKLRVFDNEEFKREHWQLVQKPKYGHGKAINPCVDCHLLMFQWAGKIMKEEGLDFVASGEVLGERPKSQNPQALKLIAKQSGIEGCLLRPLSAKLLEPTIPEQEGLIDREKLLDLQGRGRKRQIELAKKYNITQYPTPAGGCILTEVDFANKLRALMEKIGAENVTPNDINLLRVGRHFWSDSKTVETESPSKIVVGRNQEENGKLEKLFQAEDVLILPKNFIGPSALIRSLGGPTAKVIDEAKKLILKYSKTKEGDNLEFEIKIGAANSSAKA